MAGTEDKLSTQAIELINRSETIPLFVRDGFIPYIPEFDLGVDFILYREADDRLVKVQLKGRWKIDRKYVGRNIAILFPNASTAVGATRDWYMIPHMMMVKFAEENTNYLATASWNHPAGEGQVAKGAYSTKSMNKTMLTIFAGYRLTDNRAENNLIYADCAASEISPRMRAALDGRKLS